MTFILHITANVNKKSVSQSNVLEICQMLHLLFFTAFYNLKKNNADVKNNNFLQITLYLTGRCSFPCSSSRRLQVKGGSILPRIDMYSHPPPASQAPHLIPKSFHNNWTWRQRLEYEIRERDEKPKVENKKNRTKIRWRERDGG